MTVTEDRLIRELSALADAAVPPMTVDLAGTVASGRRRRRRLATGHALGALAVVATIAVGVTALRPSDDPTAPPATQVTTVGGLQVSTAAGTVPVEASGGTVHDVGVLLRPGLDDLHLVVEGDGSHLRLRILDTTTGEVGEPQLTLSWHGSAGLRSPALPETAMLASTGFALAMGFAEEDATIALRIEGRAEPVPVPTFVVPGVADGAHLFLVALTGDDALPAWPDVTLETGFPTAQPLPVGSQARPTETPVAGVAAPTLEARVATTPQVVESTAGAVLDLGVPVLTPFARTRADGALEELGYVLTMGTLGDLSGDPGLSTSEAAEEAVLIAARAPHGAVSPMTVAPLRLLRAPESGNGPIYGSTYGTADVEILGLLPTGTATARLVVERAEGPERTELPSFEIPGAAGRFYFLTLHDAVAGVAGVPASIEIESGDGTLSRFSLYGEPLD